VILTRNIDLSVASIIGLAGYGAAGFMQHYPEAPVIGGVGVAIFIGLVCGLINGLVITLGQVPSIVVTLGTLAVFRGVDSMWNAGRQISADQVPQHWLDMSTSTIFGMPFLVMIALGVLILVGVALKYTAAGRELFAIGSNPEGASLIGLPKTSLLIGTFCISGLLAGFDGALWASRYATVDARLATGFELTVIAAVVVGGVAIRGGAGSVLGVAFGALALLIIQNGLTLVRVDPLWLQGVYGLVILVAIGVDALVSQSARKARA
jgi:rhamnose transport system ATP-binding protein